MDRRLELHAKLKDILGSDNVYFCPPPGYRMKYPCIVYKLGVSSVIPADNIKYQTKKQYVVTVIDEDPDSEIPDKVHNLLYCGMDRVFTADNLNHFVYRLYY